MTIKKPTQSTRQTIEQQRAAQAWKHIESVRQDVQNKYGTQVLGLPAMIQVNGLAATVAFMLAKSKDNKGQPKPEFEVLYKHLSGRINSYFGLDTNHDFMAWIRDASMDQYRRATAEAIEYANWLKRYVEFKGWKSSEGE